MRFSTRFILYGIIGVSLSLAVAGGAFYLSTRRIILADIQAHQLETARLTMREVDRLLYKAYMDLQVIAQDDTVEDYLESPRSKDSAIVDRNLKEKLDLTGPWYNLVVADVHGRIMVATTRAMRGWDIRAYEGLNAAFEAARKGKVYHSDLITSPQLRRPTVIFAAPILDDGDGKVKGVVLGTFAWPAVLQFFDEIGTESAGHLFNRAGVIIGARTIHQEKILKEKHPQFLPADASTSEAKGQAEIVSSHGHDDVMISRADQEGYLAYRGNHWRLYLETRLDYALAPIHRMVRNLIYIVLLILSAVAAGMYAMGRRFARPVAALTRQVALLGRGDLAIRATVESADEIGQLASAFNRMVEDLGKITVSKAEMDNIINTMINTLIVATPEGKIRVVNRATLDLLGYREEELLGQSIGMIFEEEEEILLKGAGIAEILARRVVSNIEKTYRTKGGRLIPVLFSAAVMNAAPGAPADIVCVAQDISDRKALEEGLRNSYEDLKNLQTQLVQSGKLASIGELASGVAHELNQPLMVIRGTAQLIERAARKGSIPSEALLTQLEPIDRNTKRMMRIINHLRNFSRQSGTEFQPLEINHVIEECFLLIGEQLKLRDIVVERELAPDLPKIRGEANQLEQVFLNLIANSRDAVTEAREKAAAAGREAPPGGITIISRLVQYHPHPSLPPRGGGIKGEGQTRAVEARSIADIGLQIAELKEEQSAFPNPKSAIHRNFIEISVIDAGCGIPADKVSRIFDPFFTTKVVGKGTGLGLSISYGIIKNHGGEISVAGTGPEGTTMRLLLPAE